MNSDRSWIAGSPNASVVVSIRTSKPSAFSQPRIIEAHKSGSCPGQPPHTINALRMVIPSIDLSGFTSGRQHRRPLEVGLRACGGLRAVVQDRGGHVGNANRAVLAFDLSVRLRQRLDFSAGLG